MAFREKGQCREQAPGERQLTEHMIITDQGHPKQVCYGFPSGAVLLVTNGGIFQKAVATASNQTKKRWTEKKSALEPPAALLIHSVPTMSESRCLELCSFCLSAFHIKVLWRKQSWKKFLPSDQQISASYHVNKKPEYMIKMVW